MKLLFHLEFWFFFILKEIKLKLGLLSNFKRNKKFANLYSDRINYYNKIDSSFSLSNGVTLSDVPKFKHNSARFYDFYKLLINFPFFLRFNYDLSDFHGLPKTPTLVKNRLIDRRNKNCVLLPLNSWRHYKKHLDNFCYEQKIPKMVWRGAAYKKLRKDFLAETVKLNFCDVGCTGKIKNKYSKPWMSVNAHYKYKFIFSVEGNDIASNLRWILSSNSLCFMQKPKYESWFMEGLLKPGIHYVEINKDFSNIKKLYDYYLKRPDKAKKIISNANRHAKLFESLDLQYEIAKYVIFKYGKKSNQL